MSGIKLLMAEPLNDQESIRLSDGASFSMIDVELRLFCPASTSLPPFRTISVMCAVVNIFIPLIIDKR
jgi:hypothetical protein